MCCPDGIEGFSLSAGRPGVWAIDVAFPQRDEPWPFRTLNSNRSPDLRICGLRLFPIEELIQINGLFFPLPIHFQ
jgi:hypothetical protein